MTVASSPNFGLNLIGRGTSNWDALQNQNIDKLDNILHGIIKKPVSVTKLWENRLLGKEPNYSTPILATIPSTGERVIITQSWDWYVYMNSVDGTQKWRYATDNVMYGRCQAQDVDGDNQLEIFCAGHDGVVRCISEDGTTEKWSFSNLYQREGSGNVSSATSTTLIDSTKNWVENSFIRGTQDTNSSVEILSGTGVGQIKKIQSAIGNTITLYEAFDIIPDSTSTYRINKRYESDEYYQHAGQLVLEGSVWVLYVCGFDGQVVKLNASTGALIWKYSTLESIEPFPLIYDVNKDGINEVIVSSIDKGVYALNSQTGALVWRCILPEPADAFQSCDDIDNDGINEVVISCRDNRVHIINGSTGVIKYSTGDSGSDIDNKPILLDINNDGKKEIIIGNDSGYIMAFDSTGDTIWKYRVGAGINASICVGDVNYDGVDELLISDMSGSITILNPVDGVKVGEIFAKGGIEGTPLLFLDSTDSKWKMVITSLDGYMKCVRFD